MELKHRLNYSTKVTEPVMLRFALRECNPESVPDRLFRSCTDHMAHHALIRWLITHVSRD